MKTPYDTFVRLQENRMSEVRIAINVQVEQLVTIEQRERLIQVSEAEAREHGARDALIDVETFMAQVRVQRTLIQAERNRASDQLAALQAKAMTAYGELRAAQLAADDYRSDQARSASNAEQSMIDDLAAARRRRHLPGR